MYSNVSDGRVACVDASVDKTPTVTTRNANGNACGKRKCMLGENCLLNDIYHGLENNKDITATPFDSYKYMQMFIISVVFLSTRVAQNLHYQILLDDFAESSYFESSVARKAWAGHFPRTFCQSI